MIHRKHFIWFAGLMVTALLILAGCGQGKAEYTVTVSGDSVQEGVITVLDYSINVYKDEASNSCGDCEKQPVHLYAGADAEDVAEAIKDVVERADDLWEVVSCEGMTVVLREKEAGTVESIGPLSAPDGITLKGTLSGRDVPVVSGTEAEIDSVPFPEDPQRLAAVYGPSYELLTMLGAEDKIVVRADVQTDDFPWAEKETLAGVTDQVKSYAQTLGTDAKKRASEYCEYFDEKLEWVKSRTDGIKEKDRPDVYYAGVDILTTYGKHSDIIEVIESAGGNAVSADLNAGNRTQIDYEQLMAWDPDVIFIDHGGMNDGKTVEQLKKELKSKASYKSLKAVKNDQVYATPSGVFYWDMGIQKILLVMDMAKILHPDEFKDLDMAQEVMEFYEKFFDHSLMREEAEQILNRESPE